MPTPILQIDLAEKFHRLARPPIVEAVIHWQARAESAWAPETLRQQLMEKLPDYSETGEIRGGQFQFQVRFDGSQEKAIERRDSSSSSFQGYRLTSRDGRYAVQFKRDGLAFSQVNSYEDWDSFLAAAEEVWRVFSEVAEPLEIHRLGVRFINHIPAATPETVGEFLVEPPTCPANLRLKEFVYQSTFSVPDHHLEVRVIKVMQPPFPHFQESSGLFLDIDVFTTHELENEPSALNELWSKMRWLKNKVFFSLLTEHAQDSFH